MPRRCRHAHAGVAATAPARAWTSATSSRRPAAAWGRPDRACTRPPGCTGATCCPTALTSGSTPTASVCASMRSRRWRGWSISLEQEQAFGDAIEHAQQLLRLDPLDEPAWCALMRCHARRGERATALHLYQQCAALLKQELGVQPSAATRMTYREILDVDAAAPAIPGAAAHGRLSAGRTRRRNGRCCSTRGRRRAPAGPGCS